MDAIRLTVEIPKDRHLVLDLPANTPNGQAEVIIVPHSEESQRIINPAREAARSVLRIVRRRAQKNCRLKHAKESGNYFQKGVLRMNSSMGTRAPI